MEDKTSYFIPIVHDGHTVAVLATGSSPADQGEMTAGIAHNFNNLLQGVIGNLDFTLDAPEEAPSLIEKAMASADSLAEMVRQLMAYSRKGLAPERAPTELAAIINSVSRMCQSTFDPRIEFIHHVPDGVPPVHGNAGQLEQVLLNLCVNARDSVADVTGRTPRIEIEAMLAPVEDRDMVLMQVRDNGIGISAAVQARMFDPFYTTKEVGSGTGRGLSIGHCIISDHGGWIACDSKPGKGTTFGLCLSPASSTQTTVADPVDAASSRTRVVGTILLVEDDDSVRHLMGYVLERGGFTVLSAADGEEGLEALAAKPDIDLVLLDLPMPKVSGREVLRRIHPVLGRPSSCLRATRSPKASTSALWRRWKKTISPGDLIDYVDRVLQELRPMAQ